jgi:predicted dehydrogenase
MGKGLAQRLEALPEFELVAGCDVSEIAVWDFTKIFSGANGYTDYARMLAEAKPNVVVVATNNTSHASLTIQAAEAGVRGVYCEKPMATCMADGQAMVEACRKSNTALAVNHQRRLLPVFVTLRRLIEAQAIGQVELIRASCAGDILSDGTHLVDTVRHLTGDAEVKWVFGQTYRQPSNADEPKSQGYAVSGGWRYGHAVEDGAMAVIEFETGLRVELFTGRMQAKGRRYQDYEIFGTEGRLHRPGDASNPVIQTTENASWQPVTIEPGEDDAIITGLSQFARMIGYGESHPLSGNSALKDLEICMAIYESARLRNKIELPLNQPRFPLDILIEQGGM